MINIKIYNDQARVISSGQFFIYDNKETHIQLDFENGPLYYCFSINPAPKPDDPNDQYSISESKPEMKILLSNITFNKFPNGAHTINPLLVGTVNGKNLYLIYRVFPLKDTNILQIEYTFYLNESA